MITSKDFCRAASWTYKRPSEQREEHDFFNLLQDFKYAVIWREQKMIEYCECELNKLFRRRRAASRRQADAKSK